MSDNDIRCPVCLGKTKKTGQEFECQNKECGFIFNPHDANLKEKISLFQSQKKNEWQIGMYPAAAFWGGI